MASATMATGLTVGCKAKSFPSWLEREKEFAPGIARRCCGSGRTVRVAHYCGVGSCLS
jgi:hypothetical protein